MKKLFFGALIMVWSVSVAHAEGDFFGDLMVSDEMKAEEKLQKGQSEAGRLLDSRPTFLQMDRAKGRVREAAEKEAPILRDPAPFGLKWLETVKEMRAQKVHLSAVEIKDTPQTYSATGLPKPVAAFRDVLVSFGENDALWRIAAYGKFMQDDSSASKGVAQYRKYYDMLARKYGNANEFYTPVVINIEEKVESGDGTSSIAVRQEKMPIGAEGFLEKLMSGEAVLYSTFENAKVGVTLALLADGKGQTYIVVDYKNLTATRLENDELYDAL